MTPHLIKRTQIIYSTSSASFLPFLSSLYMHVSEKSDTTILHACINYSPALHAIQRM